MQIRQHHRRIPSLVLALGPLLLSLACASEAEKPSEAELDLDTGTIAYPFVNEAESLGRNGPEEKFIVRSAVGDREYSIEIPGAARDYDVQVPIGDLGESDPDVLSGKKSRGTPSPVATDREMLAALPRIDKERADGTALIDSAFGVGNSEGPKQAPSYTLGMAKIKELYKKRQYEFALVEVNGLLTFFANSPQLHKMKGTLLLRLHNPPLAEKAWIQALQLDPDDRTLRLALDRLQKRLLESGKAYSPTPPAGPPVGIPEPVGTPPPKDPGVLGIRIH